MQLLDDPQIQSQLNAVLMGVISLFFAILTGLIAWASAAVKKWLTAKANYAVFHAASDKIFALAAGLVDEAEQTLVKEAKAATADGKLTKDDAIRIRDEVVKRVMEHLGMEGVTDLQGAFGHAGQKGIEMIQRMIRTAIEARISERKALPAGP